MCALCVQAVSCAASAGISQVLWNPIQIEPLDLAPDGAWTWGDDYQYGEYEIHMFETWRSGFGRDVTFDIGLGFDEERTVTGITFNKSVTNNTDFFWSAFQIVLTPQSGSTISNVFANTNAQFGMTSVTAGGNGSWILLWSQDTGTGVDIGDSSTLNFGFDIDGNLGFMMKQTPIPAPAGALALGGLGVLGVRRRRAA